MPEFAADHEDLRKLLPPTKPLGQSVLLLHCSINYRSTYVPLNYTKYVYFMHLYCYMSILTYKTLKKTQTSLNVCMPTDLKNNN